MLTRFAHGEYYAKMMASQKKISAFFTTTTKAPLKLLSENAECLAKRKSESAKKSSPSPKKQKTLEAGVSPQSATHTSAKLSALENDTLGLVRNFGSSWLPTLEPEFKKPYFINLCSFVADERKKYTIYPKAENVFSWTTACKLRDVKVVILGQDPYHGPNQAHGLCFSVMKGVNTPPSLQNMYKELDKDIPEFSKPDHGYLMGWASQGVLLLNAVLTVRAGNANSHKDKGWEKLTDAVIQYLNKNTSNLVFMLWGSYAQKKGSHISQKKHRILKGVHPSPLSAHRGYFGCKHFSQANEYLLSHGKKAIDWNHLP